MDERFGPYVLRRRVGLGGTSEVWLAAGEESSSPPVAIKRVQPEMRVHDQVVAALVTEGELLCRLRHPNIVDAVDTGQLDGRPYICMEYAAGGDLARVVAGAPVPPGPAVRILRDVCAALDRVHGAGIVHSDVNPSNILLTSNGRALLCDFGVAATERGRQITRGTYAYMAPEQARGEAFDRRTDVFALGATLWEMLAGRRLFDREASYLTLTAVVEAPAPALAEQVDLPAEVAERLNRIAARALDKDPLGRFAGVADVAAELEAAAAELGLDVSDEALAALVVERAAGARPAP